MKLAKHIWILRIVNWMYFVALNKNKMVLSFPWIMIWGHEWNYFRYTIRELPHDWQKNHGIHHLISHTSLLALQINDTMKTSSDPPHHHCCLRCIIRLWHFDVCKPIWWRHLKRVSSRRFCWIKMEASVSPPLSSLFLSLVDYLVIFTTRYHRQACQWIQAQGWCPSRQRPWRSVAIKYWSHINLMLNWSKWSWLSENVFLLNAVLL